MTQRSREDGAAANNSSPASLSRERIHSLAGETFFARGEDYARRGKVRELTENGAAIAAVVTGAKEYQVAFSFGNTEQWRCSCPVGGRGLFCKHLAAAALTWLARQTAVASDTASPPPEKQTITSQTATAIETDYSSSLDDGPPPLPLAHLRDFLYCPRLFYLQWVENLFESKPPVADGFTLVSQDISLRRIHLEDAALGLTGIVSAIEGTDGLECAHVAPNAAPAQDSFAVWHPLEPETIRLAASALLLQAGGYAVAPRVTIFFSDDKEVMTVPLDETILARARSSVDDARALAVTHRLPPPLLDDRRCLACPAYSLCLPRESIWWRGKRTRRRRDDKTRYLPGMEAAQRPIEHIAAPDLSARPPMPPLMAGEIIIVQQPGAVVGRRQGEFIVTVSGEIAARLPLRETRAIHLYGPVQLTSQAARTALMLEVDVAYFSSTGHFLGLLRGLPASGVQARIGQYRLFTHPFVRVRLACEVIRAKIHNQRVLLMRNGKADKSQLEELARLRDAARGGHTLAELRGIEGAAARLYFSCFSSMFKDSVDWAFDFSGRNRRPPKDPVNAILSFGYSLLAKELTGVCHSVGLDPFLGFLHEPRYGRPALALDLMEEFRPLIADSVAVALVNRGEMDEDDFSRVENGVWLNERGRRAFWDAWFRRLDTQVSHPEFGYKMSYRRMFEAQARQLWRFVRGDSGGYSGFTTR
ncbi:MAG: CRISPR-associated endonuclease Cas1 [Desulfobulbaceae bacterium]|nr:CRISPR-associated endonuclease Cas1 [Desulfobulbaceae bacterium]